MNCTSKWAAREFFHVLPGLVFFYLAFNLINYTESLMFREENIRSFGFFSVLLAAAIVAKVLLVIDHLPVLWIFRNKPLIYDVVWKTLIYSLVVLLIRYLTVLYPFNHLRGEGVDYDTFQAGVDWTRFWAIQIWYVVLFFVFSLGREMVRVIGKKKLLRLLFGSPHKDS